MLLSGCDRHDPVPAATGPAVVKDVFKPVDYIALGMPAPNREWSHIDYDNAAKVIVKLPRESLPRLGKSEGCFERIVTHENLDLLFSKSLPLDQRMGAALSYMSSIGQVFKTYAMHPYQAHVLAEEASRLVEMQLFMVSSLMPLMEEFMSSLPPQQRTSVREDGKRQLIAGLEQALIANITMAGETTVWTVNQRRSFVDALKEALKRAWPYLTEPFKRELPVRAKERHEAEKDADVKLSLKQLQEALTTLATASSKK